jgi:integrase/recombinase XerD
LLTAVRFQSLADVPPELEWFAMIDNKSTRRAYENALQDFMRFIGISQPGEFREVARSHVIAWRDDLAGRPCAARRFGTAWPPSPLCSSTCATRTR